MHVAVFVLSMIAVAAGAGSLRANVSPAAGEVQSVPINHEVSSDSIMDRLRSFLDGRANDSIRHYSEQILYSTDPEFRMEGAACMYRNGVDRGDILRQVYGSCLEGTNYIMVEDNADSCLYYLNMCLSRSGNLDSLTRERHSWIVALAYNNLGLFFINKSIDYTRASEYFFLAFDFLKEEDCPDLYAILLANLVIVHYFIEDPSGLEYAELCYDYMTRHRSVVSEFVANYSMALMLYVGRQYGEALPYALKSLELTRVLDLCYSKYKVSTNTILAKIYLGLGRDKDAEKAFEDAMASSGGNETELIETYLAYGDYWKDKGRYEKAISVYRTAMEFSFSNSLKAYLDEVFRRASETSELLGDYPQALAYYKEYHNVSDSMFNAQKGYALTELKVRYRIEQYTNQIKERQLEVLRADKQRQMWLFISVLSSFAAIVAWVMYRRKNKYYERIVRQYRENMNLNRHIRDMESVGDVAKYNSSALSRSKADELFEEAERLMKEEHVYRDSELTVDRMASALKTNRTYLSQVINEKSGMNFSRYVNSYRISEAIERLSGPSENQLMKSLALDLGFKSATAFSKIFAEETGISPSAYRRKSLEIDKSERK